MTKRRFRAPGYSVSTKGHSVLHRGTYGFTPRRFASETYAPDYIPRKIYSTTAEEYALDSAVSQATSFSDASLFDTYDTVSRSRGRDQKLLSDATAAIPPSTNSPMMATSSRTATTLPGRRFLSHPPRSYIPEFDDSLDIPKTSGPSLPTSHLQASAPPRPNITPTMLKYTKPQSIGKTASRIASLKGTYDDGLPSALPGKTSRLIKGYIPRSLYHPGSPIGSGASSPMYKSSYTGTYSPRYKTSYHSGAGSPTYRPLASTQSTSLLAGYLPRRLVHRTAAGSPYGSGTQSPVGSLYKSKYLGGNARAQLSSLSPSLSPYASGTQSPITYTTGQPLSSYETIVINDPEYPDTNYPSRSRPKVLGTKRHVGNYYERLKRKRAGKQGSSKYWPYYNVEDITSDAGDVMSETASLPGYCDDGVDHWEDGGAVGGYVDTYDTYDTYDSYGDSYNDSYMDEPDEYIPFKPRRRLESPGVLELSPYEDTPPAPELPLVSRVPYVPTVSNNLSSSSKANDLYFNSLVSTSAARARTAFKNNGWNGYDNASLILSVEGDVVAPDTGGKYGFRYYHPPVPLVGSGLGDGVLSLPSPSTPAVDSFFGTYLNRLRDLRNDIRNTLDSKVAPRQLTSPYKEIGTYTPSKPSESFLPYTSYRKRLQGGTTQRVDVIELPVSERVLPSETLSLTFPDTTSAHDKDKRDSSYKLTVLDKIKIKAAIVASTVEVEPRRKRPRSKFAADKLRATAHGKSEEAVQPASTSYLHASRPPLRYRAGYRLESRMDPSDIIYKPGSFTRMRNQVRQAQDKMDRHRQLLDRYLTDSGPAYDVQGSVQRKMEELERRDPTFRGPVSVASDRPLVYRSPPCVISQSGMPSKQPVSELRRRLRRTVCKSRGDPNYYRDRE